MYNNVLLSLAMSIIPMLAIGFVILLIFYKVYIKIRSRFNIAVNCWFCNHNTKVPYLEANSWTCPSCDQYNGFTKDGDYNREIYEQLDCTSASDKRFPASGRQQFAGYIGNRQSLSNGFCNICNEAQRLKVEKLAQFEPKNESRFDAELKIYQTQLEEQYRLCSTCDHHLKKVLREKKKMVLGSKFLDYLMKGAEHLKQPHLNQIEHIIQEGRKKRLRNFIILLTVINVYCLLITMPTLKKEHVIEVLGETVGLPIFFASSHIMALSKVLGSYLNIIRNYEFLVKLSLFSRTIFMMLMYSMGLKVGHISFASWFGSVYPLSILTLALAHNVVDSFRLTRYTGMVVLWSLFAGSVIEQQLAIVLLSSVFTLAVAFTSKPEPSPRLHDASTNSFHRIYSEDYLSDDDTISILSQQLNGSSVSMRSVKSNKSAKHISPMSTYRLTKSPLTSSVFSLNQMHTRPQISPNSSFRSYTGEENQTMRSVFATPMPMPMAMPMPPLRQGLFSSNLELNSRNKRFGSGYSSSVLNNSHMLNSSFAEPRDVSRFMDQTQNSDASYFSSANNVSHVMGGRGDQTLVQPSHITSGIYSPFSASTSAVYHQAQSPMPARKLLSPTRFSTNNLTNHNSSNASWLSGGYFNQRQSMAEIPRNGLLQMAGNSPMTPMEEGLSRASSHSSGFESQIGGARINRSRENSLCPEFNNDFQHQKTLTMDNINSFQPIDAPTLGSFSPRPSVLSNSNLSRSNAQINGNTNTIWKQSAFTRRPINGGGANSVFSHATDSFNLRKINEELPAIQRAAGDMFQQQWKEGQTIS